MYKNFRVGGGIVLGLSALVLGLVGCSTTILRNSDNNIKKADNFSVGNSTYTLCTDVKEINTTDTYIFSATYSRKEYFATNFSSDLLLTSVWENKTTSLPSLSKYKFENAETGNYKLKYNDASYIGFKNSSNIKTATSASDNSFYWTIAKSGNLFKITNVKDTSRFLGFSYNNGSKPRITSYSDTKYPCLNIYKVTSAQKAYTVTFETNGGSTVSSQSVDTTAEIDLNAATTTKKYANFKGWYLDEKLTIPFNKDSYIIESDITLYAKWVATYKVTFYNEGKQFGDYQIIEEDSKISEPAEKPTKPSTDIYNYTFKHWSLEVGGNAFDFNKPITSNTNLYAVYEESFQDISETVASLESNSDITFDYIYDNGDFEEPKDTIPNKISSSTTNKVLNNGSFEFKVSSPYDNTDYGTKLGSTNNYIKYIFNEVVYDAKLNFGVKCNGSGSSFSGTLTVSCLDENEKVIENAEKVFTFTNEDTKQDFIELSADFTGISNIKSVKLNYTKGTGNLGVGEIQISAKRGSKTFKSFSNFKLNLGYTFNLAEDPRVASTGILVTGKEGFTLASNKSASLPEESYVAKFENESKDENYYIAVNFTNEEVKANYTRTIYVIPYVKTPTEYVYGTTYTTSIEKEVAKIDEKGIKDMFAAYVA